LTRIFDPFDGEVQIYAVSDKTVENSWQGSSTLFTLNANTSQNQTEQLKTVDKGSPTLLTESANILQNPTEQSKTVDKGLRPCWRWMRKNHNSTKVL